MKFQKRTKGNSLKKAILEHSVMKKEQFNRPVGKPYIHRLQEAADFVRQFSELPIKIIGDYDADGILATAILYHAFQRIGVNVDMRLPKRFSEGYGLSETIIDEIDEPALLITVDNGIAAINAIKKAKEEGFYVVVIDHHEPKVVNGSVCLPEADMIVDPKVESYSAYRDYCGAALAYRFAQELLPGKSINDLLVLASIATVADVMELSETNHALVKAGLEAINKGYGVPGLKALIEESPKKGHFTEEDYGFWFGPIFNAYGRLNDCGASRILRLLTLKDGDPRMQMFVKDIISMNEERKNISKDQTELAVNLITRADGTVKRPIVLSDSLFSEGIIGIIAGHLTEKYQCPSIVFTEMEDGILKGSGRSIPEIHLKDVLDQIQGYCLSYGGHAGAAGIRIAAENLDAFQTAFCNAVGNLPDIKENLEYDIDIKKEDIPQVFLTLKQFAPFGEGNPHPVFRLRVDLKEFDYMRLGDGTHFSLVEKRKDDLPKLKLIGFDMSERYEKKKDQFLECIGVFKENWYKDQLSYQFEILEFH